MIAALSTVYVLTVGLNAVDPSAYDRVWRGKLNHAAGDVERFRGACSQIVGSTKLQLQPPLVDEGATRNAVKGALRELATKATAGDLVVVYFSAHGAPILRSKVEADWTDESLCLYDGLLLDKELGAGWLLFGEGVNVSVITDACHSGGAMTVAERLWATWRRMTKRGPPGEVIPKTVEPDVIETTLKNHPQYQATRDSIAKAYATWPPHYKAVVMQIAACDEGERTWEDSEGGVFTRKLLDAFATLGAEVTYAGLEAYFQKHRIQGQTPQIRAVGVLHPGDAKLRKVFRPSQ